MNLVVVATVATAVAAAAGGFFVLDPLELRTEDCDMAGMSGGDSFSHSEGVSAVAGCTDAAMSCGDDEPVAPAPGIERDGLVRMQANNEGRATTWRVCVLSPAGVKVAQVDRAVPAATEVDIDLRVPVGDYQVIAVIDEGSSHSATRGPADLTDCEHHAFRLRSTVDVGQFSSSVSARGNESGCFDPGMEPARASWRPDAAPLPVFQDGGGGAAVVVGAAGALALVGVVARRHLAALAFGLFSRLAGSEVLDHETRGRIHDLVAAQPGIHAQAIQRELGLGFGQTMHHLSVLKRERLVSRVPYGRIQHYFASGRYPPAKMRALAALRHEPARRLFEAVEAVPGATLAEAASRAGQHVSIASRTARRLEDVGLVERVMDGRHLRLRPRLASA